MAAVLDHEFIAFAQVEVAKMGPIPSADEVRQRLAKIEGSMAEFIITERGDV